MTRPPTGTAGPYLDVLRSLGVPDAAVRRHHGVPADASLRAALDDELSAPTDRLLELLDGAGAVVDLEAIATGDAVFAAALARFGFDVECTAVGDDVEVVATDRLGDFVTHLRTDPEPVALRESLSDRLLEEAGVVAAPTVDGRTLLADRAALARLQELYGPRVEPFSTPLLGVEAPSIEPPPGVAVHDAAPPAPDGPRAGASRASRRAGDRPATDRPAADTSSSSGPPRDAPSASGRSSLPSDRPDRDDASPSEAGPSDASPAEASPTDPSPAEASPAEASPTEADAGSASGPAESVASDGIDDVFDDIESAAASEQRRQIEGGSSDPFTRPLDPSEDAANGASTARTTGSGDAPAGSAAGRPDATSSDAGDDGPELAGGTPKRTVSETSADDILAQARGDADFADVASDREPDPDAVLDDAAASDAVASGTAASDAAASDAATTDSAAGDAPDDSGGGGAGDDPFAHAPGSLDGESADEGDGPLGDGAGDGELTLSRGQSSTDGPLAERGGLWSEASGADPAEDTGGLPDEIRSILGRQDDDR